MEEVVFDTQTGVFGQAYAVFCEEEVFVSSENRALPFESAREVLQASGMDILLSEVKHGGVVIVKDGVRILGSVYYYSTFLEGFVIYTDVDGTIYYHKSAEEFYAFIQEHHALLVEM